MDLSYLLWLQDLRAALGGALDGFFLVVSELGEAVLPLLIACGIYWCLNKRAGLYLFFTCNVGDLINGVLKLSCCVYRPWIRDARITPVEGALEGATGYSFPSGHSTKAVTAYGGLAVQSRGRKGAVAALIVLILLIMFSRNYLGVHTPQDVLAGAAAGLAALYLMGAVLRWAESARGRDLWVAGAGLALCAAAIVYVSLKPYPLDYVDGVLLVDPVRMQPDTYSAAGAVIGLLIGWLWERRYVRFETAGSVGTKLLRFASGVAVLVILFFGARKGLIALLGRNWGSLLGAMLPVLYAVAAHPLLFTRVENRAGRKAEREQARA